MKSNNKIYIFGYGSLINKSSRKRTLKKKVKTEIAEIHPEYGYKKKLNTIASDNIHTVMGIEENSKKDTSIKGVIFLVNKRQLNKLNKREIVYSKKIVPKKYIKTNMKFEKGSKVLIYKPYKVRIQNKNINVTKKYRKLIKNPTKNSI
tara:strand:+ start:8601 stop:9044 length:444 start_codon:yes stop_codon:yes gene_type:complete